MRGPSRGRLKLPALWRRARLLVESNRLGEENFKLKDTTRQLGRQLEQEQGKRKEVEADFSRVMEELGKAEENVWIYEENMSEAYNNGFDEASRQLELQVSGEKDMGKVLGTLLGSHWHG